MRSCFPILKLTQGHHPRHNIMQVHGVSDQQSLDLKCNTCGSSINRQIDRPLIAANCLVFSFKPKQTVHISSTLCKGALQICMSMRKIALLKCTFCFHSTVTEVSVAQQRREATLDTCHFQEVVCPTFSGYSIDFFH